MATVSTLTMPTLVDLAAHMDPSGDPAKVIMVLDKDNPIWGDIPYFKSNAPMHHQTTREFVGDGSTKRQFNRGVAASTNAVQAITDPVSMYEAWNVVDKRLADVHPDTKGYLNSKLRVKIRDMGNDFLDDLFYGNAATDSLNFDGLATRMNALVSRRVASAGDTTSLSSIYFVRFGEDHTYCVYPHNVPDGGIQRKDYGVVVSETAGGSGNQMEAYKEVVYMSAGLVVSNPRDIARLCNIGTAYNATPQIDLDLIDEILAHMPGRGMGTRMYMNPTVWSQLKRTAREKANVEYRPNDPWGRPFNTYDGIPVTVLDCILNSETQVT